MKFSDLRRTSSMPNMLHVVASIFAEDLVF